jgi:hypothetical protein
MANGIHVASVTLFVSKRDPGGFEVREYRGGTSSVDFSYRIVARRNDIPGDRLARIDPQIERNVEAVRKYVYGNSPPWRSDPTPTQGSALPGVSDDDRARSGVSIPKS